MFKNSILLSFAFLLSISLLAQKSSIKKDENVQLTWGQDFKMPKKHLDFGFIGSKEEGLAQVSFRAKKDMVFQKFDGKFKPKGEEKVDMKTYPKGLTNEGFITLKDHIYWFYSVWDKKSKKEQLFVQEVDKKSLKLTGKGKKILDSKKLAGDFIGTGFYSFSVVNKYSFYFNQDSSQLLIKYRLKPEERNDKKNKDIIGLYVFDNSMNKIWGKDVKMPFSEAQIDNIDYQVDKTGDAFILVEKKIEKGNDKGKDKEKKRKREIKVLKIKKDAKEVEVIDLDPKTKYIASIRLYPDRTGNLTLIGFYSNENLGVDGVMVSKYDGDKFADFSFNEIPDNVLKQFESLRTKKKMDKKEAKKGKDDDQEAANLVLDQVRFNPDGSMTVTAEEYFWWVTITSNGKSTTRTYHYRYNDIYVMYMDADGEMIWAKKIPKAQSGATNNYYRPYNSANTMSYYYHYYNGEHYLIYMDNAKNANLKPDQAPANHADGFGGMVTSVRIDKEGNIFKKKLFDVRDEKKTMKPREFAPISPNIIINRAYGKKNISNPVVVTFDDKD